MFERQSGPRGPAPHARKFRGGDAPLRQIDGKAGVLDFMSTASSKGGGAGKDFGKSGEEKMGRAKRRMGPPQIGERTVNPRAGSGQSMRGVMAAVLPVACAGNRSTESKQAGGDTRGRKRWGIDPLPAASSVSACAILKAGCDTRGGPARLHARCAAGRLGASGRKKKKNAGRRSTLNGVRWAFKVYPKGKLACRRY